MNTIINDKRASGARLLLERVELELVLLGPGDPGDVFSPGRDVVGLLGACNSSLVFSLRTTSSMLE